MKQLKKGMDGMAAAIFTYVLWGILPVYWKLLVGVPAHEIVAHRIFWSFIFMAVLVVMMKKIQPVFSECREVMTCPKKLFWTAGGALFISMNWFLYIWAVNDNRVIETSLGYYINPLVSVLLGIVILQERLSFWQVISVILAAIGVLNIAINFGSVPWVSLLLAVSSGSYGLCKKMAGLTAITGMTLETLLIAPFALVYLLHCCVNGSGVALTGAVTSWLLVGTGVITVIPLLLFAYSANRLPLTVLGLFQYVMPTIGLILGVFLYHESFTAAHLISFILIWLALIIFTLAKTSLFKRAECLFSQKAD